MAITNAFLVEVAGAALPADIEPLLTYAYVDDSLNLPDLFVLRFRDPDRLVLSKTGITIGAAVTVSVLTGDEQAPALLVAGEVTSLEVDFDTTGTFTVVRGYDHAHRLFRGRGTHAYTQVTASDVMTAVARRAKLQLGDVQPTTTVFDHVAQTGASDWEFLESLAREIGFEVAVREGKLDFRAPKTASTAPGHERADENPLVLQLGADLLRFRAVVTAAEQVGEVQVRGWDVAQKRPLVGTAAARTNTAELTGVDPAGLATTFGNRTYVSGDVPYGTQAEVDVAATALADQLAGAFAEFSGLARGNARLRADVAFTIGNVGAPFDGKYTITSSRHSYDAATGYTTALTVSGRQDRSLLGLTSGGGRGGPGGVLVAQVSDTNDPQQQSRVKLTFPSLSDDYVSDWARTVQPGAGRDRGALVLPEVGDEVLVGLDGAGRPYVLGGLYNGVDIPAKGPVDVVDGGTGAVNRRSLVSRRGHRIDLLDEDGRTEGLSLTTADDALRLVLDATGTAVTVHSDGTVTVEGAKGVVVDAKQSKLELKGATVEVTATRGVTVDSGGGGVTVTAGTAVELTGTTAKLVGRTSAEVKGAIVRIN
ncbi:VgrG-related protein [Blastococcus sp. CT_GayMR19]|uniref:VgrG-related protein n=1 Tax=Blastococcus sp. CT_GayMR19 TaxID=2559608 RepID=UPI001ADD79F0|nr:VgrG-related protein [Blastococcus sp. CT_GayMR19]